MDTKPPEHKPDEAPAPARAPAARAANRSTIVIAIAAVAFASAVVAFAATLIESRRSAEREARVFGSAGAAAFREGACDRALRLLVAGLPRDGALPFSFQSRPLQNDLSFFGSARDCTFRLALTGHTGLVSSAAFSPDGSTIVTSSWDSTAHTNGNRWPTRTGSGCTSPDNSLKCRVCSGMRSPARNSTT